VMRFSDELLKRCRNVVDVVERDLARCSCFPRLRFSKIDDGALFRCDLLGGDFLLGLCSNKALLVSVFVACLTN
jgi:hypothetical protein